MQFCDKKKSLGKIFVYKQILAHSHFGDILIKIYYKRIDRKNKQQLCRKVKYWMEDVQAAYKLNKTWRRENKETTQRDSPGCNLIMN